MPKIKMPRSSPSLDMTPMVDLAFLLVTFFMLTASFRQVEPVVVETPSSISEDLLPENVIQVTIDQEGRAFFGMAGFEVRRNTLKQVAEQYGLKLSDEHYQKFGGLNMFGVEVSQLPQFILLSESEREKLSYTGIPYDSTNNQLKTWINLGRIEAARDYQRRKEEAKERNKPFKDDGLRYAIKADGKAPYDKVKKIIQVFKDLEIYRFNMITNVEEEPKI
jgi:biopolymer transport protein ExbD